MKEVNEMKVCVLTLGCKVNAYESEFIKELFKKNQDELTGLGANPDVIVINTCTVTNQSDAKSRKLIRQARKQNPHSILAVCGCSAQQHGEVLRSLGVDILLGNKDKSKLLELVEDFRKTKQPITRLYDLKACPFENMEISNFTGRTRAFVKIQDGCNNYCTYCIIPYVRGSIRSRVLTDAYKEIKDLVNNGYQEVVLTGIHTGSYGTGTDANLVTLIKKISELESLKRIRISSIEITEITSEFLDELKNNPKLCSHLHIPLQSGADNVLKMMNRKYDMEEYHKIINKIRAIRPEINITTDVIVGFPSETEADFETTVNNIKELRFGKLHVFPYSKRNGTVAAKLKNIVSEAEKKSRSQNLLALSDELESAYCEQFIGKKLMVLVEEANVNGATGHTSNYIKAMVNKKLLPNQEYECKIVALDGKNVKGE